MLERRDFSYIRTVFHLMQSVDVDSLNAEDVESLLKVYGKNSMQDLIMLMMVVVEEKQDLTFH